MASPMLDSSAESWRRAVREMSEAQHLCCSMSARSFNAFRSVSANRQGTDRLADFLLKNVFGLCEALALTPTTSRLIIAFFFAVHECDSDIRKQFVKRKLNSCYIDKASQ